MTSVIQHPGRRGTARRTAFGYLTEDHPGLDRVQNLLSGISAVLAMAATVLVTVLTLAAVVARSAFGAPLGWSVGFIENYLLTTIAFFGIVAAYRTGAHIAVTTVFNRFPAGLRKALVLLTHVLALITFLVIGWAGLTAMSFSIDTAQGPMTGSAELLIPSAAMLTIVPVACLFGAIIVALDIWKELTGPAGTVLTDYDPGDEEPIETVVSEDVYSEFDEGVVR